MRNLMMPRVVLVLLAGLSATAGQAVDEYQLKAAFLFNFTKFVSWPEASFKSANEPISVCILGRSPFGDRLESLVKGKVVDGRTIVVKETHEIGRGASCHVLFVGESERQQFKSRAGSLTGTAVLTVGEGDSFTAEGGAIAFKMEGGRIRLQVNVAAAEQQSVQISSKLLSIAEIVRRTP